MNSRFHSGLRMAAGTAVILTTLITGAVAPRLSSVARAQTAPAWTSIGPVGGRVTAAAIDPNGKIYAGTVGGVFTSTDSGKTWTTNTDQMASNSITGIAIDPNKMANPADPQNPWPIYAATGGNAGGVLKSVDGGKTWTLLNPGGVFSGQSITTINVDGRSALYVSTFNGLYISTDGGNTFATPLLQPTFGVGAVPVIDSVVLDSSTNPTTIYAAVQSAGIEKSTDGKNFTVLTTGLPPGNTYGNSTLAMAPSNHQILYASISNGQTLIGVYKTTDGGNTWASLPNFVDFTSYGPGQGGQAFGNNNLIVSPTDPNTVWGAGVHLARTTDGGNTWQDLSDPNLGFGRLGLDFNALTWDAQGNLFLGSDFNLAEYTSTGQSLDLTGNMAAKMFYPNSSQFGNGTLVAGGTQDNGSWLQLVNGKWVNTVQGDAYGTGVDPLDPNVMYAATNGGFTKTTDQFGMSMVDVSPPQNNQGLSDRHVAVAPNPANTDGPVVYFGLSQVSTSPDGGTTWNVGTGAYAPPKGGVTALTVSTANPQVAYVGFSDGTVQVTTDQGADWTTLAPPSGAPNCSNCAGLAVSDIAVDPNNAANVAVTLTNGSTSGTGTSPPHVIQGTNATTATPTWTEVTGNLPNESTNAVVFNGTSLIVGTVKGVYSGTPNGATTTWVATAPNFPKVPVQDLLLASNGTLTASTYGRSLWQTTLPALSPNGAGTITVSPAFPAAGATGLTFTFTYTAAQGGLNNGEVDVSVPTGWPAPTTTNTTASAGTLSVNGMTVQVKGLTLGVGQTFTITYGQGGSITSPATNGVSTFATSELSSGTGTPVPLAVQPVITTTTAGGTVPAAPTNVTVSAPATPCGDGTGGLVANWNPPPTDGGSPVTSVNVSFTLPGQGPKSVPYAGVNPTTTFSTCGLDKTKSYTANVWYTNANGDGPVASSTNAMTPARRPDPPSDLQTVAGDGEVDVTFTAPSSDNGSPVTSYTLTAEPGDISQTVPYYQDPAELTGLSDGTPYTISVTANNQDGSSTPVATSDPVTPTSTPNIPDAPTDVAARAGNDEAIINWTAPVSDNGSAIQSFTVTAHPGGETMKVGGDQTSATMTGLTDGDGYYFTVVATNGVGNSAPSTPSAYNPYMLDQAGEMVVETTPGAPANVRAIAGNGSATVSWDEPSNDGGSEIGEYMVEAMPGGAHVDVPADQQSAVVPGLHNGTAYTFTVAAVNDVGMGTPSSPTAPITPVACSTVNGSSGTVTLSSGISCVTGTIKGSLIIPRGATVLISNATIMGALTSTSGTTSSGATSLQICGSTIHGTTTISRTSGFVLVGDPFDDACAGNRLGALNVLNNVGGVDVIGNTFVGAVRVLSNTGTGPMDDDTSPAIGYNVIYGTLSCGGNTPAPTNEGNANYVTGLRSGQCAGL